MRAGLALIVAVVLASPAQACHRFHVWNYPFPQRCEVADHSWFVELVLPEAKAAEPPPVEKQPDLWTVSPHGTIVLAPAPGRTDEEGRALAIEMLKAIMTEKGLTK